MIIKVNFFTPTIVFNLNNGNVTEETAGLREGDKEFAPVDPRRRVTGPGSGQEPHAAAGGAAAQLVKIRPPQEEPDRP